AQSYVVCYHLRRLGAILLLICCSRSGLVCPFFFSSRRRHTRSVSAFLLNRSSDLDRTEANPNELNQDDARYGFRCCHLKNIWTAPLPPETELSRQMTTSTTSIDIMGLQAAYANLHTDQERDYFMQRYHDVIS